MFEFNGFTKGAENVLNHSIKEAQKLGHVYIGTEHILLGLLSNEKMVAFLNMSLSSKKLTLRKARNKIKGLIGIGMPTELTPDDMTPKCKRIIENALVLGKDTPSGQSGIKELLISLMDEPQCQFFKVLNLLGVSPTDISIINLDESVVVNEEISKD